MRITPVVSVLAAVLASVAAPPAHANLARVAALGGNPVFQPISTMEKRSALNALGTPGSLWLDDDWNIFHNPALLNNYRNFVALNSSRDSLLHGGAFGSAASFVYGAYFNRREDLGLGQPGATYKPFGNVRGGSADFGPRWPLELFIGGEWSVKWGLKLSWAHRTGSARRAFGREAADITASDWRLHGGVEFFGLEAFGGGTLSSSYVEEDLGRAATQSIDQITAGLRYTLEDKKAYVVFNQQRENISSRFSSSSTGATTRVFGAGASYDWYPLEGFHLFPHAGFWWADLRDAKDWDQIVVPLDVAAEWEFLEGFFARGSLSYDLFNAVTGTMSLRGPVRPRLGAGFKKASFEGDVAVGRGTNTHAVNVDAHQPDQRIFGFDAGWFLAASAGYNF